MSYTAGLADAIEKERAAIAADLQRLIVDAEQKEDDPDRFDRTYVLEDLIRHLQDVCHHLVPEQYEAGFGSFAYEVGEGEPEDSDRDEDEQENDR